MLFVDTSAIFALLDREDHNHQAAAAVWAELVQRDEMLVTSNYVLVESSALLGRRLGLQALRDFQTAFVPVLQVHWVDEALHTLAMAALLTAGERYLSLVDCASFELMRHLGIGSAFAFDTHFLGQGFHCVP